MPFWRLGGGGVAAAHPHTFLVHWHRSLWSSHSGVLLAPCVFFSSGLYVPMLCHDDGASSIGWSECVLSLVEVSCGFGSEHYSNARLYLSVCLSPATRSASGNRLFIPAVCPLQAANKTGRETRGGPAKRQRCVVYGDNNEHEGRAVDSRTHRPNRQRGDVYCHTYLRKYQG